jgi:membrane-associated phospholipid phosphatase
VAFSGATFLQRRYGWKLGVPAYAVSTYVAWGRVYSKRHDVWDVLAGAAIGVGSALVFTRPFAEKHNVTLAPIAWPEGGGVMFTMNL